MKCVQIILRDRCVLKLIGMVVIDIYTIAVHDHRGVRQTSHRHVCTTFTHASLL